MKIKAVFFSALNVILSIGEWDGVIEEERGKCDASTIKKSR